MKDEQDRELYFKYQVAWTSFLNMGLKCYGPVKKIEFVQEIKLSLGHCYRKPTVSGICISVGNGLQHTSQLKRKGNCCEAAFSYQSLIQFPEKKFKIGIRAMYTYM